MNIAELKLEIIAKIIATDDEVLLNKIKDILKSYDTNSLVNEPATTYEKKISKEVHIFTPDQRKKILNSLEQSQKGNTMTDKEAQADIQKWL